MRHATGVLLENHNANCSLAVLAEAAVLHQQRGFCVCVHACVCVLCVRGGGGGVCVRGTSIDELLLVNLGMLADSPMHHSI